MRRNWSRSLSLMLVLAMVLSIFSGCAGKSVPTEPPAPTAAATVSPTETPTEAPTAATEAPTEPSKWYADKDWANISFEDIPEPVFDTTAYYALLDTLAALGAEPGNEEDIRKTYADLIAEDRHISTVSSLANLRFYQDFTNEAYSEMLTEIDVAGTELMDELYITLRDLLNSEYAGLITELLGDEELAQDLREYEELTPEELALVEQESRLVNDYNTRRMDPFTVEVDGVTYTEAEIYTLEDEELYNAASLAMAKEKNAELAPFLLELIPIRNQMVEEEDGTYCEARYETYNRDYSPEETREFHAAVKEHILPVYFAVLNRLYTADLYGLYTMQKEPEEILDLLEPVIGEIAPELGASFRHLRKYGMYDLDFSETKVDAGFTTGLPEYQDAFIYNNPSGWFYDIETLIHEFGHYNNFYYSQPAGLFSDFTLDVDEIHSTGMEALMLSYAEDVYGAENAEAVRLFVLYILLQNIVEGCLYDEFQQDAYEAALDHELTVEELNRIYRRVAETYGYVFSTDDGQGYGWTDVPHTFESPFYYISYAVSAASAMELFVLSESDRDAAVAAYLQISSVEKDVPYQEAVRQAGLGNVLDADNLMNIAQGVQNYLEGSVN